MGDLAPRLETHPRRRALHRHQRARLPRNIRLPASPAVQQLLPPPPHPHRTRPHPQSPPPRHRSRSRTRNDPRPRLPRHRSPTRHVINRGKILLSPPPQTIVILSAAKNPRICRCLFCSLGSPHRRSSKPNTLAPPWIDRDPLVM